MAPRPDDAPKTFREVGYIFSTIQEDIREIKDSQKRIAGWVVTGFLLPLLVGLVLGYLFRS